MYLLYVVEISFESPLRTLQISHTMVVVVLTSVINIVVDVVSNVVVVGFAVVVDLVVNVVVIIVFVVELIMAVETFAAVVVEGEEDTVEPSPPKMNNFD